MAYDVAAWSSFFTAASAVSGVLLGLMIAAVTVRISSIQSNVPFARRNYQLLIVLFDTLTYALVPLAPIQRIAVGVIIAIFGVAALCHFAYFRFASEDQAGSRPPKQARVPNTERQQPRSESSWIGHLVLWPPLVMLAPASLIIGGISLAARGGGGLYWAMFGLVTTTGYALIYLWLVMLAHPPPAASPAESL